MCNFAQFFDRFRWEKLVAVTSLAIYVVLMESFSGMPSGSFGLLSGFEDLGKVGTHGGVGRIAVDRLFEVLDSLFDVFLFL